MKRHRRTGMLAWLAVVLVGLPAATDTGLAASAAEKRAFAAAMKSFEGGWWAIADREFEDFQIRFPKSELMPEVILRQAQARFRQGNFAGAIDRLSQHADKAGRLADEYLFWLGESHFAASNFLAAANAYGTLVKNFPDSKRATEAAYNQALACSRMGEWGRVAEVLGATDGPVRRAFQSNPTNQIVVEAILLLAEAQLARGDSAAAAQTLQLLSPLPLSACLDWRRQYLKCRVELDEGRPENALQCASNLVKLAADCGQRIVAAESSAFRADLLERLNRPEDAMAEYEANLAADSPAFHRRLALLKVVQLAIRLNRAGEAASWLKKFLNQYPDDAFSDAATLALGELYLKEYLDLAETNRSSQPIDLSPGATNKLAMALARFGDVISKAPAGPFTAEALLNRGWCLWLAGRIAESSADFKAAAAGLPFSESQAVARFKLADAQFVEKDFESALTNYLAVATGYSSIVPVQEKLAEPALYQAVRAGLEAGNLAAASNAMAMLLDRYPNTALGSHALLLTGQGIDRHGEPAAAREIFAQFEKRFPDSPLRSKVRLAVARTYEREKNWHAAIEVYDDWVNRFESDPALPQVQYRRAWAYYQAGQGTNALTLFTNVVARFFTNEIAPAAQNWVADFYFRRGDFKAAEENYQLLFQKWPASELAYQARIMAGRAAMARLGFADAIGYFTALINDPSTPSNLVAEALFAYGDATVRLESSDTNAPLANFEEAIRAFGKLQQLYPASELAILASGRIGDCYAQLALSDPKYYEAAMLAYQKVIDNPLADVAARSQAEVGLAMVIDKAAMKKSAEEQLQERMQALQHYLRVAYGKNLREGEKADPFWLKKAGLEAGRLAEDLELWEQAVSLYEYLGRLLPPLKQTFDSRIERAKARFTQPKT